jgi:two-component system cell cycle response regulator DivK
MTAHILVVDDDEKTRRFACDMLEQHGHATSRAESGEQALAFARTQRADLVLLDIQMTGLDGIETFRRLRTLPAWAGVPVIAMTASVMPNERSTMMAEGFDDFLSKPFAIKELVDIVGKALAGAAS